MSYNSLFGFGSHSKDANLKFHALMQETTGTTLTDRVGALDLSTSGMGSNPTTRTGPNGWLVSAIDFDGTDDHARSTNNTAAMGSISYGCWAYHDIAGTTRRIMDNTYNTGFWLGQDAFVSGKYGGGKKAVVSPYGSSSTGSAATWNHVVVIATGTSCVGYVNGTAATAYTGDTGNTTPAKLTLGAANDNTQRWDGALAESFLFDRAITTTESDEIRSGPELVNTSLPTLTISSTSFSGSVGSWALPSPFASGSNGTPTYQWELRDADDDSVVASGSTSTISGSGSYSGDYYLWVRASNDGGYDSAEDSVSATETASGGGPTYTLSAAYGSYTLTGNTSSLKASRKLTGASGSFTLTGQAALLVTARKLVAAQGSYSLSGQASSLRAARKLVAAQGSYATSGQDAQLRASRKLVVAHGTFALSGQNVTLVYTPIGGPTYTLTIGTGTFALTGQATAIKANRRLAAVQGSFVVTGQGVTFRAARKLVAAQGEFAMTGQAAALKASRKLVVAQGSYTLTGQNVSLNYSGASGSRAFLYYYLMGT